MGWYAHIVAAVMSLGNHVHSGVATRFSAVGDAHNPTAYAACFHRDMDDDSDRFVAHQTLPCKAKVLVCLPRPPWLCSRARVGDRGPLHAEIDLAPLVAKDLGYGRRYGKHRGFNGMERVVFALE